MKYPISLNEQELKDIEKVGKFMGIDNISHVYGSIPKIIKFSIALAIQTGERIEKSIPDVEPPILEMLLSSIKKKKILEYHQKRRESKANSKK